MCMKYKSCEHESIGHTILSMLRFCRAIKCCHVWHVEAARREESESTSHGLEHVLFLWVENSFDQSAQRRKR